jgi:hypothetical protein
VGGKLIHACLPKPVPGFVNPSPVRVVVRTSQRLAKTGLGGLGQLSVITLLFLILYVRRLFADDFRAGALSFLIAARPIVPASVLSDGTQSLLSGCLTYIIDLPLF